MTEKRFENRLNKDIKKFHALNPVWDNELKDAWNVFEMIDLLNNYDKEYKSCHNDVLRLEKENEQLKEENKTLKHHIKKLEKELHLAHMRAMFSTVKSFNGDVSKRYYYSEETDRLYDTANHYGQYDKILDKKEIAMLLNEYETMLNGDLNELHEGYLNLKHKHSLLHDECTDLEVERNRLQNDINSLEKENKELKTFKDKVFALINARIEIYKHKPFMAPVSAPFSVNFDEDTDRMVRLSELEQLKEELSE